MAKTPDSKPMPMERGRGYYCPVDGTPLKTSIDANMPSTDFLWYHGLCRHCGRDYTITLSTYSINGQSLDFYFIVKEAKDGEGRKV